MTKFWVVRLGQRIGPFDETEVLASYESGALKADDLLAAGEGPATVTVGDVFAHLIRDLPPSPAAAFALEPVARQRDGARVEREVSSHYRPPASRVADIAERAGGAVVYAGFWVRFGAVMLDGLITGLLGAALGFALGFVADLFLPGERGPVVQLVSQLAGLLLSWLYFAGLESSERCATPGKRAFHLQVLRQDRLQRISFWRATGRWAARGLSGLVLAIGYLMQPFNQRKQALHDMLAGTVVISLAPASRLLLAAMIVLALLLVVGGVALAWAVALGLTRGM
jgi:uncharacterized RDD family membrane protein YckC